MLAHRWGRRGMLAVQWVRRDRFLKSRWSFWEPWVDLELHRAGLEGAQRMESKRLFRLRHRTTVEFLYRLCLSPVQIRTWRLDSPLMREDARVLMIRQCRRS